MESGSLLPTCVGQLPPKGGGEVDIKSFGGPGKGEGAEEGVVGDWRV